MLLLDVVASVEELEEVVSVDELEEVLGAVSLVVVPEAALVVPVSPPPLRQLFNSSVSPYNHRTQTHESWLDD